MGALKFARRDSPGVRFVNLADLGPAIQDDPITWEHPRGSIKHELDVGNFVRIVHRSVHLLIGGQPGSGKSTLAVALADALEDILSELRSSGGWWESLKYGARVFSLDTGTPVVEAIQRGEGWQSHALAAKKIEWTNELARKTRDELDLVLQAGDVSIIVSDLPGRSGGVTPFLSKGADAAIILAREWSHVGAWRRIFRFANVPVVAEIASCEKDSVLALAPPLGELSARLRGRIHRPNRTNIAWNGVVRQLAELLLFDILPMKVGKGHY